MVDHRILLSKLHHYGVRGNINDWFSSYLLGRQQTTQISANNTSLKGSNFVRSPSGVGTGTSAFLIYINDISNSADQLKLYLFAVDTRVLYADRNLKSLETIVNAELSDWLTANKLSLNIKKSNLVIFRPRQKKLNHEVNLKVLDYQANTSISLELKNYAKYLGVLIKLSSLLLSQCQINAKKKKLMEISYCPLSFKNK